MVWISHFANIPSKCNAKTNKKKGKKTRSGIELMDKRNTEKTSLTRSIYNGRHYTIFVSNHQMYRYAYQYSDQKQLNLATYVCVAFTLFFLMNYSK